MLGKENVLLIIAKTKIGILKWVNNIHSFIIKLF